MSVDGRDPQQHKGHRITLRAEAVAGVAISASSPLLGGVTLVSETGRFRSTRAVGEPV
jgi:hypothetical protein